MVAVGAVLFALTSMIALVGAFAYQKYVHNTVSAFIIADRLLSPLKMDDEPDFSHSDMEDKVRNTEFERLTHKIKRVLFTQGFQRHLLVYGLLFMNCLGMQLLLFGTMPWRGNAGGTDNDFTRDRLGINYWRTHSEDFDFSDVTRQFNMKWSHNLPVGFTPAVYLLWGVEGSVPLDNTRKMLPLIKFSYPAHTFVTGPAQKQLQQLSPRLSTHRSHEAHTTSCATATTFLPVWDSLPARNILAKNATSANGFDPSLPAVQVKVD